MRTWLGGKKGCTIRGNGRLQQVNENSGKPHWSIGWNTQQDKKKRGKDDRGEHKLGGGGIYEKLGQRRSPNAGARRGFGPMLQI